MMRALLLLFLATPASAFCGFFVAGGNSKLSNNASQVVLLRNGHRTAMTMSNNYQGPPENFAMVIPVPVVLHKEDVKTLAPDVFDHIEALSAPRLVEYWEQDPCRSRYRRRDTIDDLAGAGAPPEEKPMPKGSHGVTIEAQFAVGEYEIVILSAKDSGGLEAWLHENHYTIPKGAEKALAPYISQQMKFFVAKVNIQKVHKVDGVVVLSPLRFGFDSDELRLPVRLGLLNANGKQDLIVYILNPDKRFEVANYPNVFIPTNLEVADEVRKNYAAFYAELFDATLAHANGKAVITEYAWQTSSCDPCPTPPLQASDLAVLGADIAVPKDDQSQGGSAGAYYGNFANWVLTRLHTRYDKATLSEDLIFREATPMVGGRANGNGTSEDAGAQASTTNNFQGRYIIRHYWSGPVKCKNPRYGEWGGPPNGGESLPVAARGLAQAPRGKMNLRKSIQSPVPTLGITGKPPHRRQ
jgi:hypothetical protein